MNNLKAIKRETATSGQLKKLRESGFIPAILYGGKDPNANISVEKKLIKNILNSESFLSTVLELDVDGNKLKVIPRDVSYNVISDEPIHIDFMREDSCPGLKVGGVLNIVRRKIELKCPADNIPEEIIIDLNGLEIGTSIKISFVKLPENVTPTITGRDFVVATVAAPTVLKEPEKPSEAAVEGAEGAEGTTPGAEGATTATPAGKESDETKKDDKAKAKEPAIEKKQPEKK